MSPWLPRGQFLDWPADAQDLPTPQIQLLYENGFAGALPAPPEVWADFVATQSHPDADAAVHTFGLADTGAGKLVVPFIHVLEMWPNCWPGSQGQARGDCVSWGCRNGALQTLTCDIVSGQPDEKSGKPEERPDVPEEGIRDGVLSTEAFYWWRGYNGDGWHCPSAAKVATTISGAFLRKDYPDLGVNLTRYSGSTAGKYGARKPPDNIKQVGGQRLIHQATEAQSFEATRDLLFNGYGCIDCGGEGYSNKRDENGFSRRSGSWAHSMSVIGADDRDIIKQLMGGPALLILNSWAKWNSGPRDIYQSAQLVPAAKKQLWIDRGIVNPSTGNIMIPEGSFWCRWSECSRRERIHYSGINGWPARDVPTVIDWTKA